jgi:hypothetical protein
MRALSLSRAVRRASTLPLLVCLLAALLWPSPAAAQTIGSRTITANGQTACWNIAGLSSITITTTGTWVGTLQPKASGDADSTPTAIGSAVLDSTLETLTSYTSNNRIAVQNFGYERVCIVAIAWTSGSATLTATRGSGVITPAGAISLGDVTVGDVNIATIAAGDNNIGNVDIASSALPTGASTAANQSTAIGHLSTLATASATQATAAKQDTGNTSLATIATASASQATAAKQDTQITHLSTIATAIASQATAANQASALTILTDIQTAVEATQSNTGTIATNMAQDATADLAAKTNGPQQMAYASAAAPSSVSADGDAVPVWANRAGAQAAFLVGGSNAVIGGDASNGLDVDVTRLPALVAGTALIGEVNATATAATTNGLSTCYITSAASTNSTSCKGSAGNVYTIRAINTTSTLYYLRLYNSSSAPTCSSATGFVETIPIPQSSGAGAGITTFNGAPQAYGTGIGFCLTGGGSSTDNTNAATGVYLTVLYK